MTLFAPYDHPLLEEIRATEVNALTPLDALQRIRDWQEQLEGESTCRWFVWCEPCD